MNDSSFIGILFIDYLSSVYFDKYTAALLDAVGDSEMRTVGFNICGGHQRSTQTEAGRVPGQSERSCPPLPLRSASSYTIALWFVSS